MKLFKTLIIFSGLFFAQGQLFADQNSELDQRVIAELQNNQTAEAGLSNPDFNLNYITMSDDQIEQNMVIGFAINFAVGFGIGSFLQGDSASGVIGILGDLGGFSLAMVGMLLLAGGTGTGSIEFFTTGWVLFGVGGLIMSASRVYQLIAPFMYANAQREGRAMLNNNPNSRNVNFMLAPKVTTDQVTNTYQLEGAIAGVSLRF